MLSKQDHINFWKNTSEDSWQTAEYLMNGKKYADALFMFCLGIEKLLKANWVFDNIDNYPPRIHDLHTLYNETDLDIDSYLIDFLDVVNRWNIEGRYPDYKFTLKKMANDIYVANHYQKLKELKKCLQERL